MVNKLEEMNDGDWIDVTPQAGTLDPKLYSPDFKSFAYKKKVAEKKVQTKSKYELEKEEHDAWLDEKRYN
jgi:hypothetical protein